MAGEKLTKAGRKVLENAAAGRKLYDGFVSGRSTAGGLSGTVLSLRRHRLIDDTYAITPAGLAALRSQP